MAAGVTNFGERRPIIVDLIEEGGLRRHLHIILARHVKGLVAADAIIDPRCSNHRFGHRHDLAFGKRRSEEHTSELQSLMCISYAVFCLKKKKYIFFTMTYFTHLS